MSKASEAIRTMFSESDAKRDAGLTTPEDIVRYDDICYGEDETWQVLDVYRPREREGEALPVIVSVHGGGWVYGDKERYQFYCMNLAQRGFAVVNFTYRLAPEHKFPTPLIDTNLVFSWVLSHGNTYGFDLAHIFAVGDSAGAHALGLYTAICTNLAYAKCYPFTVPQDFVPTAIALNCGAYKVGRSEKLMKDYLPEGGSDRELAQICVTDHITKKYPPTFFMTAVDDFLKDQAPVLAEKLLACEVPFICRMYGDASHRHGHVFHCDIRSETAKLCNDEECDFFRRFC